MGSAVATDKKVQCYIDIVMHLCCLENMECMVGAFERQEYCDYLLMHCC